MLTALVTPLAADRVDRDALCRLLRRQLDSGVAGVVVGGGTGEFGALSHDERREVAEVVAEEVDGRLPFFVHAGALATRDALALAHHAEGTGAAGIVMASPFGEPINWRERKRFYEVVVDATDLPVMIYNTPAAGLLSLAEIEELAALRTVSAIKDSSADVSLVGDLLARARDHEIAVYVGVDSLIAYGVANGARGVFVGTGNVIPLEIVETFSRIERGEAVPGWPELRAFLRFMERSSNYVSLCKQALRLDGLEVGEVRAPFLMPEPDESDELTEHLARVRAAYAESPK